MRVLIVAGLLSLFVVAACNNSPCAFGQDQCDDEGYVPVGGSGPAGKIRCGNGVCGVDVMVGTCIDIFTCNDENHCWPETFKPGEDDGNDCTRDECPNGEWVHWPLTAQDMDDGDTCTVDSCDPNSGVQHVGSCG